MSVWGQPKILLAVSLALMGVLIASDGMALQPRTRPNRGDVPSTSRPRRPRRPRVPRRRRRQQQKTAPVQRVEDIDRTVIRWYARGTGGVAKPRFITARELAFEARLESLTTQSTSTTPYTSKDIRAAIQRHVSETMLASLPVSEKPTPKQVASYAEAAREIIVQRIASELVDKTPEERRAYGMKKLDDARRVEGISREELDALLRRRARASWYLDKMVAPMLKPTEIDLREAHRRGETPFTQQPFEQVRDQIERWYLSVRLASALEQYFRNVRSRVRVVMIGRPPQGEVRAKTTEKAKKEARATRGRSRKRTRRRTAKRHRRYPSTI
jgi:hypothetical protein